ncbi:DUF4192 domain-containing protein [Janibacter sp. GS2]|uniref:DUF4192 domain-containing protein n=1 Tax=Janibacter sp. GS2 TaxID=3442646 RepID=UPI003EBDDDD0
MTTTVRPRTPAELAVLVPYQLGYHPGPSVILTVLSGRRLGLLQRHDLLTDPRDCRQAARRALHIVAREEATSLIVIAFEEDDGASAPLRAAVLAAAAELDLRIQEHVVVRGGRWYAPDCHDPCCPQEGLPLPRPEDVPAVAAFVHAGVAPLPSREALVGAVLPTHEGERAERVAHHLEVLRALARGRGPVVERGEQLVQAWQCLLDPAPAAPRVADLGDAVLARVALSLTDVPWRDALMSVLCPGAMSVSGPGDPQADLVRSATSRCPWATGHPGPPSAAPGEAADAVLAVRARLVQLTALVPEHLMPPVLTLVAHLAWWSGDGTVAAVCLERALAIDPDHRLAALMSDLLSCGVRPWSDPADPAAGEAA